MDNIKYRFIQNVGEYFPSGYFGDDFLEKVQKCAGLSSEEVKALCSPFVRLQHDYDEYKNFIINHNPRIEDAVKKTHDFNTLLLKILGYETDHAYQEHCIVNEDSDPIELIPVRHILRQGQQVKMYIMEMQNLISIDDSEPAGLFEQQYESEPERNTKQQRYSARQWRYVFELDKEKYKISPAIINKAITQIFLLPEERRPHFILMMAGNVVFLFDKDKWAKGSYLQFSLDELFAQARVPVFRNYYALFHMLLCKQTLAADGEMVLMDTIIEESYKNAYEVTKDLREGVILAVETLANEALYYMRNVVNRPFGKYDKETDTYDETDDDFEAEVKDDCLVIIYRLLFLFYAESREELEILPVGDEVYKRGYSLESLRDLEMVRLNSQESRDGYFFDDSIRHLFNLLSDGHNAAMSGFFKSFRVRPIDSPLFNNKNLKHLADVRIRNIKWQEIIKALSLSQKKNYCGRISYANLGVNQLGSVYESLLAYRGFYAEEDYIEVHKANDPSDGTFLVPYSRMGDFDDNEILKKNEINENGDREIVKIPRGTFVYRLNGRDRQKSASYYTPEVLTRSTVKYTLKAIIDEVAAGKRKATELLELKILEPAMGAAAFQNEVINQLSEAYLTYQQQQQRERGLKNWRIQPDKYRDELQKVKAYIATHNVYGVDLNPTAIELGKLALWLNVIHKDMETPFFANRLAVGNAVIGAWLKVYSRQDVLGVAERYKKPLKPNKWWEKAPHKVKFFQNRVNRSVNDVYHFLLPDANMLGVRSIKEQRQAHKDEYARMTTILKDWTAPVTGEDFKTLQRLSGKIDLLLKEYYTDQLSIDKYTNNRKEIWDGIERTESIFKEEEQAESYARKQQLFDTRYRRDNAYRKLKLAMDYWCALWFWEYEDAKDLPTRQEYWADIEALLDVDNDKLDSRTRQALERAGSDFAREDLPDGGGRMTEDESQIVTKTQEELLTESHGSLTLFADDEPLRLKIADRLSKRYRFFHPMLEFIEVFWLRDGFDIICGNPPWIKYTFEEADIISDKYPEVAIRRLKAPEVQYMKEVFLSNPQLSKLFNFEIIETACSITFMNAISNYPLLEGQQTNLYKCVLENGFSELSEQGYMGLLHPETVFDDPNGKPLRKELYHRLRYHFQYQNEYKLFAEVHNETIYGTQIYGKRLESIDFLSIHNLFHPSTIDGCFVHDGNGICYGIKIDSQWNVKPHKNRIVHFTNQELQTLCSTFETDCDWEGTKLVSVHTKEIVNILGKYSRFPHHVSDFNKFITVALDQTNAINNGIMIHKTLYPDVNSYEMIFCGSQIYISNALYKTPRSICETNRAYDNVDANLLNIAGITRTNYIPNIELSEYKLLISEETNTIFKNGQLWIDLYKLGFRKMLSQPGERTLDGALLPPKTSHTNGIISIVFNDILLLVEMSALTSSLCLDFYLKTIGSSNLTDSRLSAFPLGISPKYKAALNVRTLMLNCLTKHYVELWTEMWKEEFKQDTWSIEDKRLKPFVSLTEQWQWSTPLRNYFERRQALVEIDVIAAMALGLSLQDLEMIYTIQFPVLQQNENDTWYDAEGKIVFTCSKGLTGVGLDRPTWNNEIYKRDEIYEKHVDEWGHTVISVRPEFSHISQYSHISHIIDPKKSELYGGQQQTFVAPYTRCDRIADYRTAWAHFEKIFNCETN